MSRAQIGGLRIASGGPKWRPLPWRISCEIGSPPLGRGPGGLESIASSRAGSARGSARRGSRSRGRPRCLRRGRGPATPGGPWEITAPSRPSRVSGPVEPDQDPVRLAVADPGGELGGQSRLAVPPVAASPGSHILYIVTFVGSPARRPSRAPARHNMGGIDGCHAWRSLGRRQVGAA